MPEFQLHNQVCGQQNHTTFRQVVTTNHIHIWHSLKAAIS